MISMLGLILSSAISKPVSPPLDTILIGCIASLTGDNKPWGVDQMAGYQMAAGEVNNLGGIQGKKIILVAGDCASRPDMALTATEKVLENDVVAILGDCSSGNTIQISKAAAAKGIPVVACGATKPNLREFGNIFRVNYTDDVQGPAMATFASEKLHLHRVATFADSALPYSEKLNKDFTEHFKKLGGKVVASPTYESGSRNAPNYDKALKAIAKAKVDGIYMSGYFTEVGTISKRARALGIKAVFMGGDGWDSETILKDSSQKIVGGYFTNHFVADDPWPESKTFLAKWKQAHGGQVPNTTMAALGYDAMALTLDALKRTKDSDPKSLTEALEATIGFKGVSGNISLAGMNGNPPKRVIVVKITPKGASGWQSFAGALMPGDIK